jgi:hypothetical protein
MMKSIHFAVIFIAVFASACENDLEKVKLYSKGKVIPQESAKSIKIIYSDSARVKVDLTAPVLNRYET